MAGNGSHFGICKASERRGDGKTKADEIFEIILYIVVIVTLLALVVFLFVAVFTPQADPKVEIEKEVEIVEVPKYIFIEKRPAIEATSGEREMLARLVYREARGESIECQRAVVSVVINRMNKNGESVKETIFAKGQFSTAGSLDRTTPTETQYEAVDYVLMHGSTLPPYVLYFSGGHPHGWAGYQVYAVIDNTYFGYMGARK